MSKLFCDCCGDETKVAYPCKFVYYDGLATEHTICPDCMKSGTLQINLARKRLIAKVLARLVRNRK